uniref:Protein CDV3 homolog n=1 Tax=Panthera leo TaxID=9689 RepID=A0A8C8XWG2_PANLE
MPISEKEEDNEKREDPGDNWEEGGGGDGGVEESSGPWSKTSPVQAPPAAIIITETTFDVKGSGCRGALLQVLPKPPLIRSTLYSKLQWKECGFCSGHVIC